MQGKIKSFNTKHVGPIYAKKIHLYTYIIFKGAKVGTYCIIYKPMVIEYVECISYYLVKKPVELTMEYNLYFDIPVHCNFRI